MKSKHRWRQGLIMAGVGVVIGGTMAYAQTPAAEPVTVQQLAGTVGDKQKVANTVWTLIAGMLVFWMNAGFATLEAGLCRRKNSVHILAKNFIVFAVSSIAYWAAGFGMMFGASKGLVGWAGMFPNLTDGTDASFPGIAWAVMPLAVKFFFQLVFAGTAATIVSGAVAERTRFDAFMIFSFILVAMIYPVTGHWIWGGGWLSVKGFDDFAGSTVVHSVGGWAAIAGVIVIGPRLGKYSADGKVNAIAGHNMGLVALGCLILWLGWFGFNPGSTMTANITIGHIAVTTNTAAAFGAVAATIVAWTVLGKPDFGMIVNGCLAGLVAITAGCAVVTVAGAAMIGTIAGTVVVFAVLMFDKLKLDDPVGALSVHLVCGVFGTICVGLFAQPDIIAYTAAVCKPGLFYGGGTEQLTTQLVGIGAVGATVLPLSLLAWSVLKVTIGVRVSAEEEIAGLDVGEHGMEGYAGFGRDEIPTPADTAAAAAPNSVPVTA
jgi:Amt family ammonium transporter